MGMFESVVKVLLVEDDPDDHLLMRELLSEIPGANFHLDWVGDPDEALRCISLCEHDAYLLDFRLGKKDGLEVVREAIVSGCKAPLILITGQNDRELAWQALEAGAVDYLVKGRFDSLDLERTIRYALQQRRHAAELENKVAERTDELARSNEALRKSEQELRHADRKKDEFLATLAHELRNPLSAIVNALTLMKGSDDPALASEAQSIMERQLGHMVRLVDDLLDISRITHGKIKLKQERLRLTEVLNQAVETTRPLLIPARHELTVSLTHDSLFVLGDETRLVQIFANILNNAGKYTDPGGQIHLATKVDGSRVQVRVTDTGVGIAPTTLPHIFDLFNQVEPSLQRSQGGLGIGLAIVRRLVEMHGGSVEARSDGIGKGSEFLVTLPLVEGHTELSRSLSPKSDMPSTAQQTKMLVVDDNRDAARSLTLLLKATGSDVRTAHDGPEALTIAETFQPDIVLLDIGLPGLNGYDICRRLRAQPIGQSLRVIAVSGWGNESDRVQSREAGFDAHLVKPINFVDLLKLLRAFQDA